MTRTEQPRGSEMDALEQLALDLRWSWTHSADELWRRLDPELWEQTYNPWVILQTASKEKLDAVTKDAGFRELLEDILRKRQAASDSPSWFQLTHPDSPLSCAVYFSMEFMLSEALPIYSGGLGNVAGDQLKAASDLGVPVIGVGLLYQQGYFRQEIDADGSQRALYPFNDPGQLPITPVREASGEWLRIPIQFPGFRLWVRAWQVKVGRTTLYLLDTNDPANLPIYRSITSELYGGGPALRLEQELVLGIAGWRLLGRLGLKPEVCHLNEGHAGFAILERARAWMEDHKQTFESALAVTRAGNLFTTHTPVEAGFDRFSPALIEKYLRYYAEEKLGISLEALLSLGRAHPDNSSEPFNMAYLAVRGSGRVNGVSRLHGEISRRIFQPLFPRWPQTEVPISHVTNGVHMPSWDSAEADRIWTDVCGKNRWMGALEHLEEDLRTIKDEDLWQLRCAGRQSLITYTRERLEQQLAGHGATPSEAVQAKLLLNPNALTLGFARRFATYKRPNLLLHDPERLTRILTNKQQPVQLILAGKAHPDDGAGQKMIQEWVAFVRQPHIRPHAVFLSDYDMRMTERLVQGVDLWINTPRRPWEACGTSGMKVLVNGGLNLSELDGWWAEAYSKDVGWAIGDGQEHDSDPAWDANDANALYALLEQEIIPEFYARDHRGIPTPWVTRMRESMSHLTLAFSTNRSVREYAENHYLPAAVAYRQRTAEGADFGRMFLAWREQLKAHWEGVHFGSVAVNTEGMRHRFEVQIYLDDLDPNAVDVELYADTEKGPSRWKMERGQALIGATNGYLYSGSVPADRDPNDYTARIIPTRRFAEIPLEAHQILWQR